MKKIPSTLNIQPVPSVNNFNNFTIGQMIYVVPSPEAGAIL
jgi:hypothetical protein